MWSFRLRGPKGKAATLDIGPEDTMQSFCDLAIKQLGLPKKTRQIAFRSGFPPRVVEYDPNAQVQSVFARNDTVVVETVSADGSAPAIIQAPPVAAASRRASSRSAKTAAPKQGIHTLSGSGKVKAATGSTTKRKDRSEGFRLGGTTDSEDTAVAAVADADEDNTASPHRYKRVRNINLSSKDEIGISLANAVSGVSSDRAAKFFRAATRTAVDYQYEMALANARLNAALSNNFTIQVLTGTRRISSSANGDSDHAAVEMKVAFKESPRKWKEEVVVMLQPTELQAILKYVLLSGGETGKEMLKPFNMAQCSPRVFWSIARLYRGDVAAGLAELVPDEDWSYLDIRTRALSKKAMEAKANEEQWKLWKRQGYVEKQQQPMPTRADASNNDAAAATTSPTRTANRANRLVTQKGSDKMTIQRALREAMARAAVSRAEVAAQAADVVSAFTQTSISREKRKADDQENEEDDEDVEPTTTVYCDACNKARILSLDEAKRVDVDMDHWTCAKTRGCLTMSVYIVQLVDIGRDGCCDALDDEIEQIAGKTIGLLLQKVQVWTRKELANASTQKVLRSLVDPTEASSATLKDKLSAMIDEARLDEVNDFMGEIVGDSDLVGLLELQKLGTPADLVTTPIDLIYAAVRGDEHDEVTMAMVESWQTQAKKLVEEYAWLGEWRTL
ncbi:hypothetical protein FI667_g1244, partial [Globisporangium splendens]